MATIDDSPNAGLTSKEIAANKTSGGNVAFHNFNNDLYVRTQSPPACTLASRSGSPMLQDEP